MGASGRAIRWLQPRGRGWAYAVGSLGLYILVLRLTLPVAGRVTFGLSLFPLILFARCFGMLGGAAFALLHLPLSLWALSWVAPDLAAQLPDARFWVNHLIMAVGGVLAGYLFGLRRKLLQQIDRALVSEQAMHAAEQRYRAVFDNAADSIIIYDMAGRFLEANQIACERFGLSREELLRLTRADVMPPVALADEAARMERLLRGEIIVFEGAHRRSDGTLMPMEVSSRIIQYREAPAILSIARDITERRRDAEALRASQQMLRLIMDHIPTAVFWKDRDLVYLGCNREFALDAGLASPDEVVGKTDYDMPWTDQAELYRADDRAVMESGQPKFNYEEPQTTPLGQQIWLRTSKVPMRNGEGRIVAVLGMYEDITEQRLADRALRDREQFLALLNGITRVALQSADLRAMLQMLAERLGVLFQAEGCLIALTDTRGQPDAAPVLPAIMTARSGSATAVGAIEARQMQLVETVLHAGHALVVEPDRETPALGRQVKAWFPGQALLVLPLIAGEQRLGAVFLAFPAPHTFSSDDLVRGDQVAAQIALAVSKAHLVEAMRAYIAELEARNEELDAFGHTVAHDLKEPLSIMIGYAELLTVEGHLLQPAQVAMALQTLGRQGERMRRIIDELLLLAGLRNVDVHAHPLDMKPVVEEAIQRFAHAIEGQQVTVILPATWPVALGYAPWVEEVWANYLSNALKYGGHPLRLEFGAEPTSDGMVRFWLRDNGQGLTPEIQARLFTPFPRLRELRVRGHGLGLSIVRRIIEKLGGRVGAENVLEGGSRFWFELPQS